MSSAESTPSPSSATISSTNGPSSLVKASSPALSVTKEPIKTESSQNVTPKPSVTPTSFSEWQLLAVLQRANLVQYYDIFISQGGDDINQIMQCDEQEFLEIMSLVGMLSKPLHVRRFQRALTEFSKDQASFNLTAIQQIGAPPALPQFAMNNDPMSYLMPGFAASLNNLTSTSPGAPARDTNSPSTGAAPTHNSVPLASDVAASVLDVVAPSIGGTANILSGQRLRTITATAKEKERSSSPVSIAGDFVSLGETDPNNCSDTPILSDAQLRIILDCAQHIFNNLPVFQPKLIQNKKRVSREVLDLMTMPSNTPGRTEEYRKYAAIYGRFDAKRKPDKVLSLHEVSVNEAAAQLCLLMPALLTRRDELFPLARQVVKDAGYHYKSSSSRKRPHDSPNCSPPPSPPPCCSEEGSYHLLSQTPSTSRDGQFQQGEKMSYLEKWAASKIGLDQQK